MLVLKNGSLWQVIEHSQRSSEPEFALGMSPPRLSFQREVGPTHSKKSFGVTNVPFPLGMSKRSMRTSVQGLLPLRSVCRGRWPFLSCCHSHRQLVRDPGKGWGPRSLSLPLAPVGCCSVRGGVVGLPLREHNFMGGWVSILSNANGETI